MLSGIQLSKIKHTFKMDLVLNNKQDTHHGKN